MKKEKLYLDEVKDFAECGLCGTAAVISPVGKIVDHGKEICLPSGMEAMGPVTIQKLYDTLTGIQMGQVSKHRKAGLRRFCNSDFSKYFYVFQGRDAAYASSLPCFIFLIFLYIKNLFRFSKIYIILIGRFSCFMVKWIMYAIIT